MWSGGGWFGPNFKFRSRQLLISTNIYIAFCKISMRIWHIKQGVSTDLEWQSHMVTQMAAQPVLPFEVPGQNAGLKFSSLGVYKPLWPKWVITTVVTTPHLIQNMRCGRGGKIDQAKYSKKANTKTIMIFWWRGKGRLPEKKVCFFISLVAWPIKKEQVV